MRRGKPLFPLASVRETLLRDLGQSLVDEFADFRIGFLEPLSLAMQVLGAVAATVLADRIAARATIVVVALANLIILAALAWGPVGAFLPATALFGFLWMFVLPFQIPLVIAADPTRRAAALIGGAQLTGSSLGPLTAAMLVSDIDPLPVLCSVRSARPREPRSS